MSRKNPAFYKHRPEGAYSPSEAAAFCGVSPATVRRYIKRGLITPHKDELGWQWLSAADLEAITAQIKKFEELGAINVAENKQ